MDSAALSLCLTVMTKLDLHLLNVRHRLARRHPQFLAYLNYWNLRIDYRKHPQWFRVKYWSDNRHCLGATYYEGGMRYDYRFPSPDGL